jgi:hypothetical protein
VAYGPIFTLCSYLRRGCVAKEFTTPIRAVIPGEQRALHRRCPSGQDIGDGDPADLGSVDDDREKLAGGKVLARVVTFEIGESVDLDLAVDYSG